MPCSSWQRTEPEKLYRHHCGGQCGRRLHATVSWGGEGKGTLWLGRICGLLLLAAAAYLVYNAFGVLIPGRIDMDFPDLVKRRFSLRKYSTGPVPDELIEQCLEAARARPSACNSQPWTFNSPDP